MSTSAKALGETLAHLRERNAELQKKREASQAELTAYKLAVDAAHATLDSCGLVGKRDTTHEGLSVRILALLAIIEQLQGLAGKSADKFLRQFLG